MNNNLIHRAIIGLSVAMWFGAACANAANFDCKKAMTEAEKTICGSPELSKLDKELAKAYREALKVDFDKTQFQIDHQNWLKRRDFGKCGAEVACLEERYQSRLAEINSRTFCRDFQRTLDMPRKAMHELPVEQPIVGSSDKYVFNTADIDNDGAPDTITKTCGAQECFLQVELSKEGKWQASLFSDFAITSFQSRTVILLSSSMKRYPLEEKKNHRAVQEITRMHLQSLCPTI